MDVIVYLMVGYSALSLVAMLGLLFDREHARSTTTSLRPRWRRMPIVQPIYLRSSRSTRFERLHRPIPPAPVDR